MTDDTAAIQLALNSAPVSSEVDGDSHAVYLISAAGTVPVQVPSGSVHPQSYCLRLPSGITLNLRGATLRISPRSNPAYLIINAEPTVAGGDHDLGLKNAILDGSSLAATQTSLFGLTGVNRPRLSGVTLVHGIYQGIFCWHCSHGVFNDLTAEEFQGQPYVFGTPVGQDNLVYDSQFGHVSAHRISSLNTLSQPGNGFQAVLRRCTIQSISTTNCAAGIKLQGPGSDVSIGTVFSDTCGDASLNSGLKFQGDAGHAWFPVRMTVDQVICKNQTGTGLYMERDIDCHVGHYTGIGNATLGRSPDVWVGGIHDRIDHLTSRMSGGDGVLVRANAKDYHLGIVSVLDPGQNPASASRSGVSIGGGSGTIDRLAATDDQAYPTMRHGLQNAEPDALLTIGNLQLHGALNQPFVVRSTGIVLPQNSALQTSVP